MSDIAGLSFIMPAFGKSENKASPDVLYDVVIVGGGPAAMSAAIYSCRKMLKTALLAKDFGGQVAKTSMVENYIGFQAVSGSELVRLFEEHAKSFEGLALGIGEKVVNILKADDGSFSCIHESGKVIRGRSIIMATGKRYRPLNVPGEEKFEGRGIAYCATCDAPLFKDKRVFVAGGGNSAFESAIDLIPVATSITMVNFIKGWQADEILQEKVLKSDKVSMMDMSQITEVVGEDKITGVRIKNRNTDEINLHEADGIFVEIGLIPNSEPVKDFVELNAANEIIIDCRCKTNIDGFFAAGDVTNVAEKQIIISAGEGAKACLSAYRYLINNGK